MGTKLRGKELFDHLVMLTGLPPTRGTALLRRLLYKAAMPSAGALPSDYLELLPALRARLKAYMSDEHALDRIRAIDAFLRTGKSEPPPAPLREVTAALRASNDSLSRTEWLVDELKDENE